MAVSNMDETAPPQDSFGSKKHSHSEADALMAQMAQSIDVTRLQFKRIHKDLSDCEGLPKHDGSVRVFGEHLRDQDLTLSREIRTALFADVHFLLISLNETDKILTRMKALFPQDSELSNLRNKYRPLLKRCSEFRQHMELFDKDNGVEDFGSLASSTFKFHGRTIELDAEFEKCAESFFCELMSVWTKMSNRQRKIRDLISRAPSAG